MPLQSPQFSILKVKFSQPSKFLSDHLLKGQIAHNWGHILLCSKSNKRLFSCTTLTISVVKSTNLNSKLELLKPTTGNFPPTKGIFFWPKQGIIFSPTKGNISSTHKREFFFVLIVYFLHNGDLFQLQNVSKSNTNLFLTTRIQIGSFLPHKICFNPYRNKFQISSTFDFYLHSNFKGIILQS